MVSRKSTVQNQGTYTRKKDDAEDPISEELKNTDKTSFSHSKMKVKIAKPSTLVIGNQQDSEIQDSEHLYENTSSILQTADIIKYESKEIFLNLNGSINKQGNIYSILYIMCRTFLHRILGGRFGTTNIRDEVFLCRHLAYAVVCGLITDEELLKVKTAKDFSNLNLFQNLEEIKDGVNKNITVLEQIEKQVSEEFLDRRSAINFMLPMTVIVGEYLDHDLVFDSINVASDELEKLKSNSGKNISATEKKIMAEIANKLKYLKKESLKRIRSIKISEEIEVLNSIDDNLEKLKVVLGMTAKQSSVNSISRLIKNLNEHLSTVIEKIDNQQDKSVFEHLKRFSEYLKEKGYNKDAKKLDYLLKEKYLPVKTLFDISNVLNNLQVYKRLRDFTSLQKGQLVADLVYEIPGDIIGCSELSFPDALYHMCKPIANSPDNTEESFLLHSDNHVMGLKIKHKGGKIYVDFYDPNKTDIITTIELPSAEHAKKVSIRDFLSFDGSKRYQITDSSHVKAKTLNDNINMFFIKKKDLKN